MFFYRLFITVDVLLALMKNSTSFLDIYSMGLVRVATFLAMFSVWLVYKINLTQTYLK